MYKTIKWINFSRDNFENDKIFNSSNRKSLIIKIDILMPIFRNKNERGK